MRPVRWVIAELRSEWRGMSRWGKARELTILAFYLSCAYIVSQLA